MRNIFLAILFFTCAAISSAQQNGSASHFDGNSWWAHVKFLADDSLEGRDTGSEGLRKAQAYAVEQLQKAGLEPAGSNGFYQPVRFNQYEADEAKSSLALVSNGQTKPLSFADDAFIGTRATHASVTLSAPLVFIGYGLQIPEKNLDELAELDLKGKIVGVSGFGGSTHHGALLVLEHLGVDTKDVSILNVGNSALRLAALRFKKIDATILDTAFVRKAEELGFKRLVSLADLGEIPSTGLMVTTTKLKKQPDQIRRVVRATLNGTSYFKENRGEMISFIVKKLAVETKEAEELFELGVKVFSSNGRISDEGLSVLWRQRDPKRQLPIKPSDVVDWSFLPTNLE